MNAVKKVSFQRILSVFSTSSLAIMNTSRISSLYVTCVFVHLILILLKVIPGTCRIATSTTITTSPIVDLLTLSLPGHQDVVSQRVYPVGLPPYILTQTKSKSSLSSRKTTGSSKRIRVRYTSSRMRKIRGSNKGISTHKTARQQRKQGWISWLMNASPKLAVDNLIRKLTSGENVKSHLSGRKDTSTTISTGNDETFEPMIRDFRVFRRRKRFLQANRDWMWELPSLLLKILSFFKPRE